MSTYRTPQQRAILILATIITILAGLLSIFVGKAGTSGPSLDTVDYLLVVGGVLLVLAGILTLVVTKGWSLNTDELAPGHRYIAVGTVVVGVIVIVVLVALFAVSQALMRTGKTAYNFHRFMESLQDSLTGSKRRR